MLHLILGILKVIGIILLVVLGLLLLAILTLLFVPVRYRLEGKKEAELLEGSAGVSWLLHLIGITADYKEKQLTVKLKLFGISIKRFGGGKEISAKIPDTQDYQKSIVQTADEQKREPDEPVTDEKKTNNRIKRIRAKITVILKKISDLFSEVQEIPDKLEKHKNSIKEKLEPFLQDDARNLLGRMIGHLRNLWKHYRPRRIKGWLHFGTGAPDITGELTGLIYLLLPSSADQMNVIPDFTEKVLETDIALKGHVRACHMAKAAFLLWQDKAFRNTLRRVRGK